MSKPTTRKVKTLSFAALKVDDHSYYGGLNSPSMVSVTGRDLILSADRSGGRYLSSEVQSAYFLYGTVTVRARLSAGTGMWPAIWLVSQDSGPLGTPEIDMVEVPQARPGATSTGHFTYHWHDSRGTPWQIGTTVTFPFDLTQGFHTYSLNWQPKSITLSVDGAQVLHVESTAARSTGITQSNPGQANARRASPSAIPIFGEPMHLRINNGVGRPGSWAGAPDRATPFPNSIVIKSITIAPQSEASLQGTGSGYAFTGG